MKVLFVNEYFPPFAPGGGEWSTYYLAKDLAKFSNKEVNILTLNFSSKKIADDTDLKVYRIPFYKKLDGKSLLISAFYFINPVWVIWYAILIMYYTVKLKIDILHIHGKYSIPAVRLANFIVGKKIIITARDNQIICNYGFCLYHKYKSCSIKEYFTNDFSYYLKNYINKITVKAILVNLFFAIGGRLTRDFIKFFARNCLVVTLSKEQRMIFKANGFSKVIVINNSSKFPDKPKIRNKEDIILFAGRLTDGKGVNLIIDLLPKFFQEFPNYRIYFAGAGGLRNKLDLLAAKDKRIRVFGEIGHIRLITMYGKAKATLMPSLWPEPFGRIALESLSCGTPVVGTKRGGIPEIVQNGRWGILVKPESQLLLNALKKVIIQNDKFHSNIIKDYEIIRKKFGVNIAKKYLGVYEKL